MQKSTVRHCEGRESKLEISIKYLPSELEETYGRWIRKIIEARRGHQTSPQTVVRHHVVARN
ncbi:hypothetical protein LEMLEM_LOCUS8233 [Lemmus lemmus]